MMTMKMTGAVHFVGQTEAIGQKGFAKRVLVLTDNAPQWPHYSVFEAKRGQKSDHTKDLDGLRVGDEVEVTFALDGREYNGKWYGGATLLGVKVTAKGGSGAGVSNGAAEDDVPF